jgi:hypothetical protein
MTDIASARFALPLLQSGQAQKELVHNEAVSLLDLIAQASVVAVGVNVPPAAPTSGQSWIVGVSPTGAWAGKPGRLAGWTDGGWRFVDPVEGMAVWNTADSLVVRHVGGAWVAGAQTAARLLIGGVQVVGTRGAAIADPTGGATVDSEARGALSAILAMLRTHGLIAA